MPLGLSYNTIHIPVITGGYNAIPSRADRRIQEKHARQKIENLVQKLSAQELLLLENPVSRFYLAHKSEYEGEQLNLFPEMEIEPGIVKISAILPQKEPKDDAYELKVQWKLLLENPVSRHYLINRGDRTGEQLLLFPDMDLEQTVTATPISLQPEKPKQTWYKDAIQPTLPFIGETEERLVKLGKQVGNDYKAFMEKKAEEKINFLYDLYTKTIGRNKHFQDLIIEAKKPKITEKRYMHIIQKLEEVYWRMMDTIFRYPEADGYKLIRRDSISLIAFDKIIKKLIKDEKFNSAQKKEEHLEKLREYSRNLSKKK